MSRASLFERAMAEEFEQLDAAVQRFHRLAGRHCLVGEVRTQAPASWPARLLALCLGTPRQGLHAGTALAGPLKRALQSGGALQPAYRTDIQRLHRKLRFQGAVIELALDRGHLIAGEQRLPVHEIEFELISGPPVALPALAAQWARRHALWWDVRTKSERGFRLAQGLATVAAVRDGPASRPGAHASRAVLMQLLAHALPNAAELASGSGGAAHQAELLRALQALAAALRGVPGSGAQQAQAVLASLHGPADASALVRSPPFTALMLKVLAVTMQAPQPR